MITEGPVEQAKRGSAAIGDFIREQREQAQVSMRQLARLAGVSNPYLSQIAKGLAISAEQLYVRAGILETRTGNPELVAAILADEGLTERQKQVLLEVYESFRRENAPHVMPAGTGDDAPPATTVVPGITAAADPAPATFGPADPHPTDSEESLHVHHH